MADTTHVPICDLPSPTFLRIYRAQSGSMETPTPEKPANNREPWDRPQLVALDLSTARGNFCTYTDEDDFKVRTACAT